MGWLKKLARWVGKLLAARYVFLTITFLAIVPGTIFRLNIEKWAEENGWDRVLLQMEGPVTDIIVKVGEFLASDIVLAFALGGLAAAYWERARRWIMRRLGASIVETSSISVDQPIDIQALGIELKEFSQEMQRAINAFISTRRQMLGPAPTDFNGHVNRNDIERETMNAFFAENFRNKSAYYIRILQSIGIPIPPHIGFLMSHRPNTISMYLGFCGELLSKGMIERARNITDEEMWHIQGFGN